MKRPKILTVRFEIRLSPQDKSVVEQHARSAGMTVTSWVRLRLLLDQPAKETVR